MLYTLEKFGLNLGLNHHLIWSPGWLSPVESDAWCLLVLPLSLSVANA